MSELADRVALGIDENQRMVAERTAQSLEQRVSVAPGIGSIALPNSSRLERLYAQFEQRRETLLTSRPFRRLWTDHDDSGRRFFTVPDHGDLLAPEFQFSLAPEQQALLDEVAEKLSAAYDPWSTWFAIAGIHSALGGRSPEDILCEEGDSANLAAVKDVLLSLLPDTND